MEKLKLNDRVSVNSSCEYYPDWRNVECRVVGLHLDRNSGYEKIDVTILDENNMEYDGFDESELDRVTHAEK